MIEPKIRMIEPKDGSGFCLRNCQESCGSLVYREMQSESDGWPWRVPTLSNQSDLLVATLEKVCTLATSFSWQDNLPEEIQLWIIGMSSLSPGLLLVPPCLAKIRQFHPLPSDWNHTVSYTSDNPEAFYGHRAHPLGESVPDSIPL